MTGRRALRLLALAAAGYLVGSVSSTRLVGRVARPDLPLESTPLSWREGVGFSSNDISPTTLELRAGPRLGVLASVLDIAKAAVPVAVLLRTSPDRRDALVCSVAIMAGHNWPAYHRFQGGRGTSVALGSLLVIDPLAIPASIVAGQVVGIYGVRDLLFAQHLGWFVALPFWFALRGDRELVVYALAVNGVRWAASAEEIRQWWPLYRSGELRTQAFHEAIERTHMGAIHGWLRSHGLVHYDYMDAQVQPAG